MISTTIDVPIQQVKATLICWVVGIAGAEIQNVSGLFWKKSPNFSRGMGEQATKQLRHHPVVVYLGKVEGKVVHVVIRGWLVIEVLQWNKIRQHGMSEPEGGCRKDILKMSIN